VNGIKIVCFTQAGNRFISNQRFSKHGTFELFELEHMFYII
jgi:hypothetical protein